MTAQTLAATQDAPMYRNINDTPVSFNLLQEHALIINNLLSGLHKMMATELASDMVPFEEEGALRIWLLTVEKLSAEVNAIFPDKLADCAPEVRL
ncbi:hypothetical protein KL86DPRO_20503 [uncultured delta proteobacterium]|uniref:Uncharacterized protein n=1 Tax=uncultured delta proteobacterium TaxID=34034 RepID=A0A212K1P1_9DELT|nr:hypothetical protein KL86DPRO_20503 [uncultured delta proteobacterium]